MKAFSIRIADFCIEGFSVPRMSILHLQRIKQISGYLMNRLTSVREVERHRGSLDFSLGKIVGMRKGSEIFSSECTKTKEK